MKRRLDWIYGNGEAKTPCALCRGRNKEAMRLVPCAMSRKQEKIKAKTHHAPCAMSLELRAKENQEYTGGLVR